jgi:putative transferase (TIGR04331 family)
MENKNKITYPLSLKDRVDYINEIEKIVLDVLVDEISNLFPKKIIKILYAPWCHFAVHALYGGYEKININKDNNWRPELAPGDTQNFMAFARSESFLLYLQNFPFEQTALDFSTNLIKMPLIIYGKFLFFNAGFPKNFIRKLTFLSFFKVQKLSIKKISNTYEIDRDFRKILSLKFCHELAKYDNSEWISKRLTEMIPRSLLEGLEFQKKYYSRDFNFDTIFSSDSWSSLDTFKIFAFTQRGKRKIKFIGAPHAFNHSVLDIYWLREYEIEFLDKYLLWGNFSISKNKKCIPFYATKFVEKNVLKPIIIQNDNPILISVAARPTHTIEFPYHHSNFIKYTNTQIKLVKNLHTLTNKKIIVRTREKNRGNSLEKSYSKEIISEDIIILNQKGDFIKGLENFSLHIADNTSTTILDSLWKNFPTLILITDDYFKISSNALQTFSGLSKVGVFHRDIESILEQMKVIKADINKWWTNEILQMEVKLFLESHAKSLNDPNNWLKSFCKI